MLRSPRSLLTALLAIAFVITCVLGWFGWKLLAQQREIDARRALAQLDTAVDAAAAVVRGRLADAGDRLSAWLSNPASSAPAVDHAIVVAIDREALQVVPRGGLPFVPMVPVDHAEPQFADLESLEFRDRDWISAAKAYRSSTTISAACVASSSRTRRSHDTCATSAGWDTASNTNT